MCSRRGSGLTRQSLVGFVGVCVQVGVFAFQRQSWLGFRVCVIVFGFCLYLPVLAGNCGVCVWCGFKHLVMPCWGVSSVRPFPGFRFTLPVLSRVCGVSVLVQS